MSMTVGELRAYLDVDDRQFNSKVDAAHRKFSGLGNAIQSTGAKIGAGLVAFGIGRWLQGSIDVVHQYEVTIARLKTVVEATGGSWGVYSEKMKDVVDKESQISAFSGGELRGSLADLTQITGDGSKALNLLGLTSDLARGKQMDLATASKLVGKVAMGNYGVLARYGIIIAKGTSATDALAQLQARFAGQAKAYGDTSAGAQDKLRNALKKLQLTVGTALVPALTKLAGVLVVVLSGFNKLPGPLKTVIVGVAAVGAAATLLAPFVGTIKSMVKGTRDLLVANKAWIASVPKMIAANALLIASFAAVAVGIYLIVKAYQAWRDAANQAASAAENAQSTLDKNAAKLGPEQTAQIQAQINADKYKSPQGVGGWMGAAFKAMWNYNPLTSGLKKFGSGGDFIARGAQQIVVGDNPAGERVTVTPLNRKGTGGGPVVNLGGIHFHAPVVGGKAGLRELSSMVQNDVMQGVRRGLVGQNA